MSWLIGTKVFNLGIAIR